MDYSRTSPDYCYVRIDARIVARAMRDYHKNGFTRATMSGDAWMCAKQMIGSSDGRQHQSYAKWDKYFPRLPLALDRAIRAAYFGGINYSWCKGINQGRISHYDIHNSYGAVMMWRPMPYGFPVETHEWPREDQHFVAHVRIKLTLREGLMPWFQFKNGLDNIIEGWDHGTLVRETKEWHTVSLTSVDLDILDDWYVIEFDDTFEPTFWIFRTKEGLLQPYLD